MSLLLFIALNTIDGFTLFEKAKQSAVQRSYSKHVEGIKNTVLNLAWEAAIRGEFHLNYCLGKKDGIEGFTRMLIREDLVKSLNLIPGLNAFGPYTESTYPCLNLSWNQ